MSRQSGAKAATSAGLLGSVAEAASGLGDSSAASKTVSEGIVKMSGGRLKPIVVRRRVARLLAAKSSLACRADCYRQTTPFVQEKQGESTDDDVAVDYLDSGAYGASLGDEAKRQLTVWAEAKGVQFNRSAEQMQVRSDVCNENRQVIDKSGMLANMRGKVRHWKSN